MTAVRLPPPRHARWASTSPPASPARSPHRGPAPPDTRSAHPAVTVCHDCGARCTGDTGEARHVTDTGHARYDLELDKEPTT